MRKRTLRCMITKDNGLYVAICLDLSLGAQANTLNEAKAKLEAQIDEILLDARDNPQYASALSERSAPLSMWIRYYQIYIFCSIANAFRCSHQKVDVFYRDDCTA